MLVIIAASLIGLDLAALALLPGEWLYGSPLFRADRVTKADAILVLCSGLTGEGELDTRSRRRVLYGCELFREGYAPHLVFSGGARPSRGLCGAEEMADLAARVGIPPERLLTEAASCNSLDNWRRSETIIESHGWKSVLLVASVFQMSRLDHVLRRSELDVCYAPVPYEFAPRLSRVEMWRYAHYSQVADILYRILPEGLFEKLANWSRK